MSASSTALLQRQAKLALACLDLTSLNEGDTEASIHALAERAQAVAQAHGPVAALCVWPRLAAVARQAVPQSIRIAAVANFPDGGMDVEAAVADAGSIVQAGAQEVDLVLPYRDLKAAPALVAAVRRACEGLTLKVILETGELGHEAAIKQAARIAMEEGADFIKTSTGKRPVSATLTAARWMLESANTQSRWRERIGFKPAGGIRTVAEAAPYMALTAQLLGEAALTPTRFRIGASSLLADIERVLGDAPHAGAPHAAAHQDTSTY